MVKLSPQKSRQVKRRSTSGWSSLFARRKKFHTYKVSWKVKRHVFSVSKNRILIISRRTFRTNPARRSKKIKQFVVVVNNYPFPVREVAFQIITKKSRRKSASSKVQKQKILFRYALTSVVIVSLSGIMFFAFQIKNGNKLSEPVSFIKTPTVEAEPIQPEPQVVKPKVLSKSEPTNLKIERLGINYPTKAVGKLADGTMETPPVLEWVTGWYKYSPTPGELGPSIIVGHVDSYKGPSVFWRLREVLPGDIIEVARADGSVASFKVDSLQQFDQSNFPTETVYGNIDHAGLRLITCGGTFNRATGHYTENTVVFASLVL